MALHMDDKQVHIRMTLWGRALLPHMVKDRALVSSQGPCTARLLLRTFRRVVVDHIGGKLPRWLAGPSHKALILWRLSRIGHHAEAVVLPRIVCLHRCRNTRPPSRLPNLLEHPPTTFQMETMPPSRITHHYSASSSPSCPRALKRHVLPHPAARLPRPLTLCHGETGKVLQRHLWPRPPWHRFGDTSAI